MAWNHSIKTKSGTAEGESMEFSITGDHKRLEAANVTGPDSELVQGSRRTDAVSFLCSVNHTKQLPCPKFVAWGQNRRHSVPALGTNWMLCFNGQNQHQPSSKSLHDTAVATLVLRGSAQVGVPGSIALGFIRPLWRIERNAKNHSYADKSSNVDVDILKPSLNCCGLHGNQSHENCQKSVRSV